jgi:hypothetical protein
VTPQLESALAALDACPDADAVAALLRRHEVRALYGGERCDACPIAAYFVLVGGAQYVSVYPSGADLDGRSVSLSHGATDFIHAADRDCYPDLEAAA